jgi:uncharacterized protein Usg
VTTTQTVLLNQRLTTAEILYHLPDHPALLQSFIWQHMDVAPDYPRLREFLDYWEDNIEGRLHSVTVAGGTLNTSSEIRHADARFLLH